MINFVLTCCHAASEIMKLKPLIIIASLQLPGAAAFRASAETSVPAIVTHIMEADTTMVIAMPDELSKRLIFDESKPDENPGNRQRNGMAGFRVQVFSDNNIRTAKNEARSKEMTVASRFPQYRTYKKYSAPYWRVHVGDFRTQREAQAAAAEMRKAFPSFGKEIRVVRDRINIVD